MTFRIRSAGFEPFYCPPCPEGMLCNMICIDPLDFLLVAAIMFISTAVLFVLGHELRAYRFREVSEE